MKKSRCPRQMRRVAAFTLIELIVVISIIAILAALIFPIVGVLDKRKKISLAQAELAQIQTAIEGYKTKLGFYPPDNPNNVVTNQLYFELLGTTIKGTNSYTTLDGSAQIDNNGSPGDINAFFNVQGFANSSASARATDEGTAATAFLNNLLPKQSGQLDANGKIKILVCSIPWPDNITQIVGGTATKGLNPWRYTSSYPTNNSGSYDLWVDLVIKGKTNRISNWSKQAINL